MAMPRREGAKRGGAPGTAPPMGGHEKGARPAPRPLFRLPGRMAPAGQPACWMAESCQGPPRRRRKVHSSVAVERVAGSPSTTRPWVS